MSVVIDFTEDGQAQAMHRDGFDLGFLGGRSIERASEICFDEASQLWDVHALLPSKSTILLGGARRFGTYESARATEVAWFDSCRLQGVAPTSGEGQDILENLRAQMSS